MRRQHALRPTASTRRARGRLVTVLVVALALVVSACGGSGDEDRAGEPAVAIDASGDGGRSAAGCPDGRCDEASTPAEGRSAEGAESLDASAAAPTTTAPGSSAEADTSLRAGSVDDNARWDDYLRYRQWFDTTGIPVERIEVEGRQVLSVVDAAGRPVLGAEIEVRDAAGATVARLRTYADGRALFHAPTAADPDTQDRPVYGAVVRLGDTTTEVRLTPEQREYQIVLEVSQADLATSLDVLFLIDATGSMSDEIDRLKANLSSVAEQIAALPSVPDVRYGLTVYRDRGEEFVTRTVPFTGDLAAFASSLAEVQADAGGDDPEDLAAGLADALTAPGWRGADTVKLVFLVADAPPHLDYDGPRYSESVIDAAAAGIKILPVASSGLDAQGEYVFRQLAQITTGRFVFLTYGADGRTPGDSTPHQVDDYSVLSLDALVVQLVTEELAYRD